MKGHDGLQSGCHTCRVPKDHISIRIPHSGSKAQNEGDTRNPCLLDLYVYAAFRALMQGLPTSRLTCFREAKEGQQSPSPRARSSRSRNWTALENSLQSLLAVCIEDFKYVCTLYICMYTYIYIYIYIHIYVCTCFGAGVLRTAKARAATAESGGSRWRSGFLCGELRNLWKRPFVTVPGPPKSPK